VGHKNHRTRRIDDRLVQPCQPVTAQWVLPIVLLDDGVAVQTSPMHLPMIGTTALPTRQDQHRGKIGQITIK
jgi:hypothetical protein